jgi:hypothetical protein
MPLDIAFFGSSLVSAYWNGAATYYRGIVRALHERGHRVTFYEPDAFGRQEHRDLEEPAWARVVVYAAESSAGALRSTTTCWSVRCSPPGGRALWWRSGTWTRPPRSIGSDATRPIRSGA